MKILWYIVSFAIQIDFPVPSKQKKKKARKEDKN